MSGQKGSGKSTFTYHFINYLLSRDEEKKYSLEKFEINKDNFSYKLLKGNIHPNFFFLDNIKNDADIKIDQVRKLLKFLSKSNYSKDIKIVLIDNSEYLNLSSSNALLKALEEPSPNTFFFIIYNNSAKLLDTIKSRCVLFNFTFSFQEKRRFSLRLQLLIILIVVYLRLIISFTLIHLVIS